MIIHGWEMHQVSEPLVLREWELEQLDDDQVAVRVEGCGVCETDLEYLFGGVELGHPLPLTLGHEVSGTVIETGEGASSWLNSPVVLPAAIPCGHCRACTQGQNWLCPRSSRLGCDIPGGFASHVLVPTRGLCAIDPTELSASHVDLADLAVLADAVATPYEAIARSHLQAEELAIFVGAGGIGRFGLQIASLLDAHVMALDVDDDVLEWASERGVSMTLNISGREPAEVRRAVASLAHASGLARATRKVYETSGTAAGQAIAFELLTLGAELAIVGYASRDEVAVRLGNLTAYDAVARGTRTGPAAHYSEALELILAGDLDLSPCVERQPMSRVNDVLSAARNTRIHTRPILIPDFD